MKFLVIRLRNCLVSLLLFVGCGRMVVLSVWVSCWCRVVVCVMFSCVCSIRIVMVWIVWFWLRW